MKTNFPLDNPAHPDQVVQENPMIANRAHPDQVVLDKSVMGNQMVYVHLWLGLLDNSVIPDRAALMDHPGFKENGM